MLHFLFIPIANSLLAVALPYYLRKSKIGGGKEGDC